ncbi:MAG: tetratricopeptide repeat protein [Rhizobiaceae bacterium]|nr:tetratricopeptide repeat protein [Rhizobiaceae bacterium]
MSSIEQQVQTIIQSIAEDPTLDTIGDANVQALKLGESGHFEPARQVLERALAAMEVHHPDSRFNIAVILSNLGLQQMALENYQAAKDLFRQAIAIREELFGPDDPRLAGYLQHLGQTMVQETGDNSLFNPDHTEARRILERAFRLYEAACKLETEEAADCMVGIATTYNSYHPPEEVAARLSWSRRAAVTWEGLAGPESLKTANALFRVAWSSLYATGGPDLDAVFRAIAICEKHEGALQENAKMFRSYQFDLSLISGAPGASDDYVGQFRQHLNAIDPSLLADPH